MQVHICLDFDSSSNFTVLNETSQRYVIAFRESFSHDPCDSLSSNCSSVRPHQPLVLRSRDYGRMAEFTIAQTLALYYALRRFTPAYASSLTPRVKGGFRPPGESKGYAMKKTQPFI
jgi:hypothetical protein